MIKPINIYCIVKKKNPKLSFYELYPDKDIDYDRKTEKIIRVKISEIK